MLRRVFVVLLFAGCSASQRTAPSTTGEAVATVSASTEAVPARLRLEAMRDDILCNGPCPASMGGDGDAGSFEVLTLERVGLGCTVDVRADGTVIFQGYPGGKLRGRVVEHIDARNARALVRRFDNAGAHFNQYGVSAPSILDLATDVPVSSLKLRRGRRELTIVEPAGAPFALADEVERVTRAERCATWSNSTFY